MRCSEPVPLPCVTPQLSRPEPDNSMLASVLHIICVLSLSLCSFRLPIAVAASARRVRSSTSDGLARGQFLICGPWKCEGGNVLHFSFNPRSACTTCEVAGVLMWLPTNCRCSRSSRRTDQGCCTKVHLRKSSARGRQELFTKYGSLCVIQRKAYRSRP